MTAAQDDSGAAAAVDLTIADEAEVRRGCDKEMDQ